MSGDPVEWDHRRRKRFAFTDLEAHSGPVMPDHGKFRTVPPSSRGTVRRPAGRRHGIQGGMIMSRIFGRRIATAAASVAVAAGAVLAAGGTASASPHSDAQRVGTGSYATDNDRRDRDNNRDRQDRDRDNNRDQRDRNNDRDRRDRDNDRDRQDRDRDNNRDQRDRDNDRDRHDRDNDRDRHDNARDNNRDRHDRGDNRR
ncbi:hypothetical protein DKG34_23565 [Streptomyces sp. NWU49]|nr:hypothetical protein DKG34_23565 [Streptomyces sp. NWU49]